MHCTPLDCHKDWKRTGAGKIGRDEQRARWRTCRRIITVPQPATGHDVSGQCAPLWHAVGTVGALKFCYTHTCKQTMSLICLVFATVVTPHVLWRHRIGCTICRRRRHRAAMLLHVVGAGLRTSVTSLPSTATSATSTCRGTTTQGKCFTFVLTSLSSGLALSHNRKAGGEMETQG